MLAFADLFCRGRRVVDSSFTFPEAVPCGNWFCNSADVEGWDGIVGFESSEEVHADGKLESRNVCWLEWDA